MFENPRRDSQGRNFYNKCSENSRSQIFFRTDIFQKLTLGTHELTSPFFWPQFNLIPCGVWLVERYYALGSDWVNGKPYSLYSQLPKFHQFFSLWKSWCQWHQLHKWRYTWLIVCSSQSILTHAVDFWLFEWSSAKGLFPWNKNNKLLSIY